VDTKAEYITEEVEDQLEDESNDHGYFCMLPNILDEMLDPYQYRLYGHLKRVCGERKDKRCWQSTKTIAKACRMSTGKVSECKQALADMGLIRIEQKTRPNGGLPYHKIAIVDIWARNIAYFTARRSSSERPSSQDEQASSPGETKKNPHEEEPKERGASAPPAPDDELWPDTTTAPEKQEPPQEPTGKKQVERMRSKMGADPFSVGAYCQERQAEEGAWTVPVHQGLSPACAVFKEATGYRPAQAVREDIDAAIPNNDEALYHWYKVAHGWVLAGNKWSNVGGMLEWYAEGRTGYAKPQGDGRNGGSSTPRQEVDSSGHRRVPQTKRAIR
jgi:hypothetical protein